MIGLFKFRLINQKTQSIPEPKMKKVNRDVSWTPFTDNLKKEYTIVDNELEKSLDELGLFSKAHLFGLIKGKLLLLRHS